MREHRPPKARSRGLGGRGVQPTRRSVLKWCLQGIPIPHGAGPVGRGPGNTALAVVAA